VTTSRFHGVIRDAQPRIRACGSLKRRVVYPVFCRRPSLLFHFLFLLPPLAGSLDVRPFILQSGDQFMPPRSVCLGRADAG